MKRTPPIFRWFAALNLLLAVVNVSWFFPSLSGPDRFCVAVAIFNAVGAGFCFAVSLGRIAEEETP